MFEDFFFLSTVKKRDGVGMSEIRTLKGQNVKSFFKDDQKVERSERRKSNYTFDVLIFFDAIGNIRTSKVFWATTYGVLPICTKACGGLG